MKELKFKTSKGDFLLVEGEEQAYKLWGSKNFISKLSEITEEQASNIVDNALFDIHFRDYCFTPTLDDTYAGEFRFNTAIESLHSLLKSKGIYLYENPYPDAGLLPSAEQQLYREAEAKTFYNPYIFKL